MGGSTSARGVQEFIETGRATGQLHTIARVYDTLSAVIYPIQFVQKISRKENGRYIMAQNELFRAYPLESVKSFHRTHNTICMFWKILCTSGWTSLLIVRYITSRNQFLPFSVALFRRFIAGVRSFVG